MATPINLLITYFLLYVPPCISVLSAPQESTDAQIEEIHEKALRLSSTDSIHQYAQLIYQLGTESSNQQAVVKAKVLAAYCFWDSYQLDTAKILLNESLEYFHDQPALQGSLEQGRALLYFGMVTVRSNELHLAKLFALNALKIFKALGNLNYQGKALNILGAIENGLTNYARSLEYFHEAYSTKLAGGAHDVSCIPEISNISNVYSKMGQYDKALEYAHKSLSLSIASENHSSHLNSLNTIGAIHAANNNLDSALHYYGLCKEKAILSGKALMAFLAEYNTANTHSNFGRHQLSNQLATKLLQETHDIPSGYTEMVQTLIAKNHLFLNEPERCIMVASPVYQKIVKRGNKQAVINLTEILWKAYEQRAQYDSAFHYRHVLHAYKDSVYNIENQRKLSSLYAELETIEKQKEIEILLGEKKLQEAKTLNLTMALTSGGIITFLIFLTSVLAYRNREKLHKLHKYELQTEIEQKMKDLNQQSLKIIQKDKNLSEIEEGLKKIKSKMINGSQLELQQILNTIRVNKSLEKEWEKFDEYFGNANNSFYDRMSERFPDLTISEKRLASLIKMNLTNREIANIMNIEDKSVRMAKYRLKKKLNLSDDQSVNTFLADL